MTPRLSPLTRQLVEAIFDPKDVAEAARWLEGECGNNLPFCREYDEHKMERIRFAALKLSQGDPGKLLRAIDLAQRDWRDVLVAADFGNHLDAHERWARSVLEKP